MYRQLDSTNMNPSINHNCYSKIQNINKISRLLACYSLNKNGHKGSYI